MTLVQAVIISSLDYRGSLLNWHPCLPFISYSHPSQTLLPDLPSQNTSFIISLFPLMAPHCLMDQFQTFCLKIKSLQHLAPNHLLSSWHSPLGPSVQSDWFRSAPKPALALCTELFYLDSGYFPASHAYPRLSIPIQTPTIFQIRPGNH